MKTVPAPRLIRDLLAMAPLEWKRAVTGIAGQAGFRLAPRELPSPAALADVRSGPIVVSGFFSDTRGIAQGARLSVGALRDAGFAVITHDITYLLSGAAPTRGPHGVDGGIWLLHCNPPEADPVLRAHPELARQPMLRIGYWAWELPRAPESWLALSSAFHEIWAPSTFTAASLGGCSAPIRVMPHPVPLMIPRAATPQGGPPRFLCFADLRSSAARKNPSGAIRAFLTAFPQEAQAILTVKISGSEDCHDDLAALRTLIGQRSDIELVCGTLDAEQISDLFTASDVLVSLHRSEGFGLPIAEAMAAGKAVIATAWSGNVDFMPSIGVQRVPASLTAVNDTSSIYAGQVWADPDLNSASASMRQLAQDPHLRRACGLANRESMATVRACWDRMSLDAQPFARFAMGTPSRVLL